MNRCAILSLALFLAVQAINPNPLFDKSLKNHMAVLIALIAMEKGDRVTEEQINTMLEEATAKIHKKRKKHRKGVIELKFKNGTRTMSAIGNDALEQIREIETPFAYYRESFEFYEFVHGRVLN